MLHSKNPQHQSLSASGHRPPLAGVILCGGRSTRMGTDKALVELHGRTLLQHVVHQASVVCTPTIVVASAGQRLPALPSDVAVIADEVPDAGPLAGLLTGLRWLDEQRTAASSVWLTGCDTPLVTSRVIGAIADHLGAADAVAITDEGYGNPLLAVYRRTLHSLLRKQFAAGERSLSRCLRHLNCHFVPAAEVAIGTQLINVNTPEALARARNIIEGETPPA